ncbi:glycosyltransferase family 2 protein [Candidatus Pelagibacter sp.]|nr:glycosyltransferase family 2 protein [Candidatus Pelagibacter sp.]
MNKISIAIIIPVYNVGNYVKQTLDSVKNQLSNPDEVIVINDGSTDNSGNIISAYNHLENWRIIQKKNQGLGLTRNYGRSIAKSEYIYFLDSDDIIKNNLVLRLRELIQQNNKPDIILFSGETFSEEKSVTNKVNLKFTLEGEYFRNDRLITKLFKKKEILPQSSRYITKNKLWIKNNLSYPKGIAEDEALFFPLLALSERTLVIQEVLYMYRTGRKDSITMSSLNINNTKDYLDRINNSIDFMKSNNKLIKNDKNAWNSRLERKGINLITFCLKTDSTIYWKTIFTIFFITKNIMYLFKIIWRILKFFLTKFLRINDYKS